MYFSEADAAWHGKTHLTVVPYSSTAHGYFASAGQSGKEGYDNPVSRARLARRRSWPAGLGPRQTRSPWPG